MQVINLRAPELPYELNEELKLLRTNLQFCGVDKRVILVTSAFSGEGKSSITFNLGRALTELDKSVLLIDCDMRKSVLKQRVIGFRPEFGLSHYLSGQCGLDDIIYSTSIPNFSVVFSGVVPPNPTELLSNENMSDLITIAKESFDYVILDCPPVGMVVDAAVVAPMCDGSVIVIESGEVKYRLAQEVLSKLKTTNCPILGVVLNKVNRHRSGKYYGGYYKYKYKYNGYYK